MQAVSMSASREDSSGAGTSTATDTRAPESGGGGGKGGSSLAFGLGFGIPVGLILMAALVTMFVRKFYTGKARIQSRRSNAGAPMHPLQQGAVSRPSQNRLVPSCVLLRCLACLVS
jgi:hypothetical protein